VSGTPSFVVNGKFLEGALPLAEFRKIVAEALGTASTAEAAEVSAGPIDAPVTIVWFSDLRSPLASSSSQLIHEAMGAFPGKIRVVFKNFPLQFHADAFLAHEAALAAGAQGKFWEMEELIIRNQAGVKEDELIRYAVQLRLDKDKFVTSLNNGAYRGAVEKDLADGQNQNVRGAPVFFINGKRIDGIQPLALFKQTIETELKQTIAAN
jgi:protein-disulfide isomerase